MKTSPKIIRYSQRFGACAAALLLAASAPAASLALTNLTPTPGPDDVYNFSGGDSHLNNVSSDDAFTYVAYDRNGQGQTFTTGGSSGGYLLTDLWIRHCGYTTLTGNGTWYNWSSGAVVTLRVTAPSKVGQPGFAISTETYSITGTENGGVQWSGGGGLGDDMWLHFTLATPVSLAANTQYGFDLTATVNGGNNYFEWLGNSTNVYSGGWAYSGTLAHTPTSTIQTNTGDRVFLVQLGHVVPALPPELTASPRYVPAGQSVNVTATIPSIANADRSVNLVLTNNNPGLISLPGGVSKLTLNFAAGATNVQTFNVQVLANGVGSISVVTNAAFTDASILIGTPVSAQEQFLYDPTVQTTLDGANGGSGFGGAWSQPTLVGTITTPGLSYLAGSAALVTNGNAAAVSGAGNEAFRALSATYGGVGGGTVWISFLVQASSGLGTWGGVSLFSGTNNENLFIGEVVANSANNTWGFSQSGNYNMSFPGSITPGTQVDFLVCQIDFPATNGGQALVSFYADPTLNNTPPYSPVGSAHVGNFTFDTIRLGTSDSLVFDEIRIGSDWTNVMQFTGSPQPLLPPTPTLSTPARLAPVGHPAAVTVSIPVNTPRPLTLNFTNDNPTAFSLSSTNASETTLTFPVGGTNVQTLNVQVLAGGAANLTVVSNAAINTASIIIGAQASASESFQYAAGLGALLGMAGGTGFDVNAWTGGGDIISPGLVYPGLLSSSNAASLTASTADRTLFPISGNYGGAGGGTVWISFLVRGPVPSDVASAAGLSLLNGTTEGVLLGLNSYQGGSTWGWAGPGMGPFSQPGGVVPGTNVDLLVYRLDFPATAGDLVNVALYTDPVVGPTAPAPSASGAVHYFTFNAIRIASSVTNDFDEIRVGGTWADVVPAAPSAPSLSIVKLSSNQVQISWPAGGSYTLKSSTSLLGSWGDAGLSVSTSNGTNSVTDTITGTAKFYRLQ
jgi:hypothetical protein